MASSSGTSSVSSMLQNSGSEENLQVLMVQRKRKRMLSNRESARRSRMRKQKHLDDLTAQMAQLKKENHQIISSLNITSQHYMNIEADNSVLRAQAAELNNRLQSLNEIITFLNANHGGGCVEDSSHNSNNNNFTEPSADCFFNPLNLSYLNQPIMASAEMFQY
ncbi:bZIP transcription factor 11 [Argentina anserina]|uniref:bZIP transcription factor 11 n=1 Tax=Argentina anserina TaxID=57926 RepID=UPI00217644C1|nr:bZIP transcription factor 11 [Potentilla anserina]